MLEVDARQFEALLDACDQHGHRGWLTCSACAERLSEALALYRGDFLSQLSVSNSAGFDE